jgi:hypothetical protein
MNEFFGSTMGGQNPYAGQDTGFGDFAQNMDLRKLLAGLYGSGQPPPEGNFDAVDPAQAAYADAGGAMVPNFTAPSTMPMPNMGGMEGRIDPRMLSMMQTLKLRGL